MDCELEKFDVLLDKVAHFLEENLKLKKGTVDKYKSNWRFVKEYMVKNKKTVFSRDVAEEFLEYWFKDRNLNQLTLNQKGIKRQVMVLVKFLEDGTFSYQPLEPRIKYPLEGPIGEIAKNHIFLLKVDLGLSTKTIQIHQKVLSLFCSYCIRNRISEAKIITTENIINFLNSNEGNNKITHNTLYTLRAFLRFLFNTNETEQDFSHKIPKLKIVKQPKLPSTFKEQDIEKLINSIERTSSSGKRNYAIILLGAKLGMRASDIARLKFENLKWDSNLIEVVQSKTAKALELPLLTDIGNAIIDYIKFGRPKSDSKHIFLSERPPFVDILNSNLISSMVKRVFRMSGVCITGKKTGSHSLRHSLGSRLLERSIVLTTISEVLGHQSTESTKFYLRIDAESMKECTIEVPIVDPSFYIKNKNFFL